MRDALITEWIDNHGPYLYHGTTQKAAQQIVEEGLYPQDELGNDGNYDEFFSSRPGHVYLGTEEYIREGNYAQGGLLAIDLRRLNPDLIHADEDHFMTANANLDHPVIQKINRLTPPPSAKYGAGEDLGTWADRIRLGDRTEEIRYSLERGSIAYGGRIPPEAIIMIGSGKHDSRLGSEQSYLPEGWQPVTASGDQYVECQQGHTHWGTYGAAGILLRHVGADGERYLLTYRSPEVHQGDCWGIPGGAIDSHESAVQGALREMREEILGIPTVIENATIIHSNDHGGWAYHTVLADVANLSHMAINPDNAWETSEARWMSPEEIDQLHMAGRLHPGFSETWMRFRGAASADELHVSLEVPRHAAKAIYRWARDQDWPEGTELEKPAEYHCTLLYSKTGSRWREYPWWIKELERATAKFKGFTSFGPTGDGQYAYVLLVDSDEVQQHGQDMTDQAGRMGLHVTFPEYKPHITIGYGPIKVDHIQPPNMELHLGPSSISEPRLEAQESARTAGAGEVLDNLSLKSVAHNLHYRFEQGTDPQDITEYAERLLKMIGYTPDEMNVQAAIQTWQQLYPSDRLIEAPTEPRQIEAMAADPYWLDDWTQRNGPYLYHLSPSHNFDSIKQNGLVPWDHPSNKGGSLYDEQSLLPRPGHVYLRGITNLPKFYDERKRADQHLYRVDTRKLDPALMNPDEDSMKNPSSRRVFDLPNEMDFNKWDTWAPHAEQQMSDPSQTAWSLETPNLSSENNGTIAYGGSIPPEALELMPYAHGAGEPLPLGRSTYASANNLYHWANVTALEGWTDPAYNGPGSTWLTTSGNIEDWNPDVPQHEHPIRIAIDTHRLNPALMEEGQDGNILYRGHIPNEAIIEKKPIERPESWEDMNVTPSLETDWQSMGEDERHHNNVQFSNDTAYLA